MFAFRDEPAGSAAQRAGWLRGCVRFFTRFSGSLLPLFGYGALVFAGLELLPGRVAAEEELPTPPQRPRCYQQQACRGCGVPCRCAPRKNCGCQVRRLPPPPKRQIHHVFVEKPSEAQPAAAQPAQPAVPPGAFMAPPQSGTVVRESVSRGIRGLRIRFPALTLELPSIELPSITRREHGAYMEMNGGRAPYVPAQQPASYYSAAQSAEAQQPAGQGAVQREEEEDQPATDREEELEDTVAALQNRCERLEHLLQQMIRCQTQKQPCPPR